MDDLLNPNPPAGFPNEYKLVRGRYIKCEHDGKVIDICNIFGYRIFDKCNDPQKVLTLLVGPI